MTMRANRLTALHRILQRAVEDGGGNLLLELGSHIADRLQQPIQVKTGLGRSKDHRRVIEKEQVFLDPFTKFRERRHFFAVMLIFFPPPPLDFFFTRFADRLRHQIPFVHHDNAGFALSHNFVGYLFVLLRYSGFGVEDQDSDVAAGDGILSAFDAEELDRIVNAAGFALAGRIDEQVSLSTAFSLHLKRNIDRISRGARYRADNHPLGFGKGVDNR